LIVSLLALVLVLSLYYFDAQYEKVSLSPESRCEDGTVENSCSVFTGLYCKEGKLVEDCRMCGCVPESKTNSLEFVPSYTSASDFSETKTKGYILQFKQKPYFSNAQKGLTYRNLLQAEHTRVRQQANVILGKQIGKNLKVYGEFSDSFNGIALDISQNECLALKSKIPDIEGCYPNFEVRVLLDKALTVNGADSAPSFGLTGKGSVIAVIDTGIDDKHESLNDLDDDNSTIDPKIIGFKDFVNYKSEPYDDHGHGTHVAGIAAGTGGNSKKFRGVAPGSKLVGVKVLDEYGSGTFSDVIMGIEWTVQNKQRYGINVISMSLGANVNGDGTTPVEIAATTAVEQGINFVVAAGNAGPGANSVGIPASAKNVISVGAVNNDKEIASFSSRGPTKDGRIKPEVVAPGVSISAPAANSVDEYIVYSGTSMATPFVSGVVALIHEMNYTITPNEIRNLFMNSSEDRGEVGPDNVYGYGVINTLNLIVNGKGIEKELVVSDLIFPKVVGVGRPIQFSASIKNYGKLEASNVAVRFFIDDVEKGVRTVSIAGNGEAQTDFTFAVNEPGNYNIKVAVDSLTGEVVTVNNERIKTLIVNKFDKKYKAVVLDSWGSEFSRFTIFEDINQRWSAFGKDAVEIDYKSLNKKEVTYDLLKQSEADVLIISNAWSDGSWLAGRGFTGINWEFSDSEIEAIKKYVSEGHGLIVTSGTLSTNTPGNVENNMKLGSLVGIDEKSQGYWRDYFISPFKIFYNLHDVFKGIQDLYDTGQFVTNIDLNKSSNGELLAKSVDDVALITDGLYGDGNSLYFSHLIEFAPYAGFEDEKVFYNSIVWASQKASKNNILKVNELIIPESVEKGEEFNVSFFVNNLFNESVNNVSVRLESNGVEDKVLDIGIVQAGERKKVDLPLTLSDYGVHKIVIKVDKALNEDVIYDNIIEGKVNIPRGKLTGKVVDSGIDYDGNGLIDAIKISVEIEVFEQSSYSVEGVLTSGFGVLLSSENSNQYISLEQGKHNIDFIYSTLNLKRIGLNGPYKLADFSISERGNGDSSLLDFESVLHKTQAYSVDDFESYPDVSVYSITVNNYNSRVLVNENFDINVQIQNVGNEKTKNVVAKLYRVNYDFSLELLQEISLAEQLDTFERGEVKFTTNSGDTGSIEYIVKLTSDGDKNLENNDASVYVEVVPDASDLTGYFSIDKYRVIKDEKLTLKAYIYNKGTKIAENSKVEFFEKKDGESVLISENTFGTINAGESKEASFEYTPSVLGDINLIGKITSDDEILTGNNEFYAYLYSTLDGPDVSSDLYVLGYPVVQNKENNIRLGVRNLGSKTAEEVSAELFEVSEDRKEKSIAYFDIGKIESGSYIYEEVKWTPTDLNIKELLLKVSAKEDVNLENNEGHFYLYILPNSPNVNIYRDYNVKSLPVSKSSDLNLYLNNYGGKDAENVDVYLYAIMQDSEKLIGTKNVPNVKVNDDNNQISFLIDPTNICFNDLVPNSISVVPGSPPQIRVSWQSNYGFDYQVQSRTDLVNGVWENEGSVLKGNGGIMSYDVPVVGQSKFFRVMKVNNCLSDKEGSYVQFKVNWTVGNGVGEFSKGDSYFDILFLERPEVRINSFDYDFRAIKNLDRGLKFSLENIGTEVAKDTVVNLYTNFVDEYQLLSTSLTCQGLSEDVKSLLKGNMFKYDSDNKIWTDNDGDLLHLNSNDWVNKSEYVLLTGYDGRQSIFEVREITNSSSSTASDDELTLRNILTGDATSSKASSEGSGYITLLGTSHQYSYRGAQTLPERTRQFRFDYPINNFYCLEDSQYLGDIEPGESKFVDLNVRAKAPGNYAFKVDTNHVREDRVYAGTYQDNILFLENGPDVIPNILYYKLERNKNKFLVGNSVSIPFELTNDWNGDAKNVLVELFVEKKEGNVISKVAEKVVPLISVEETLEEELSFVPEESGYYFINVFATTPGGVNGVHSDGGYIIVKESSLDVSGKLIFNEPIVVSGEKHMFSVQVDNVGNLLAKDIKVKVYDIDSLDDKKLVTTGLIESLNPGKKAFIKDLIWTPASKGKHSLQLELTLKDEKIIDNNNFNISREVFEKKKIAFNILNSSNSFFSHYVSVNGKKKLIEKNNNLFETIDSQLLNVELDHIHYTKNGLFEGIISFSDSSIVGNEANAIGEVYLNLSNGSILFDSVYAYKPDWNNGKTSYALIYTDNSRKLGSAKVYLCSIWNFTSAKCDSSWIDAKPEYLFVGKEGVYAYGNVNGKFGAVGLSTNSLISTSNSVITPPRTTGSTDVVPGSNSDEEGGGRRHRNRNNIALVASESKVISNLQSDNSFSTNLDNSNLVVSTLGLQFNNPAVAGLVNFKSVENPSVKTKLNSKVYSYFEITHSFSDSELKDGSLQFKVDQSWLKENNIDKDKVTLLRYVESVNGAKWVELPTSIVNIEGSYINYQSDLPGLSLFAVSVKSLVEQPKESIDKIFDKKIVIIVGTGILVIILIIISLVIYLKRRNKNVLSVSDEKKVEPVKNSSYDELFAKTKKLVADARNRGYKNEDLVSELKRSGWSDKEIDSLLG
jgi:PGF-pre-PGF domain-containing protein